MCSLHHPSDVACLQLVISYTEAKLKDLGLDEAEAAVDPLTLSLHAVPGEAYQLVLPAEARAYRSVLNDGSLSQRSIIPATILRVVDKYALLHLFIEQFLHVSCCNGCVSTISYLFCLPMLFVH